MIGDERLIAQVRQLLHDRQQVLDAALAAAEAAHAEALARAADIQAQLVERLNGEAWCPHCPHCAPPPFGWQAITRPDGDGDFTEQDAIAALRELQPQRVDRNGPRRTRRIG